MTKSPNHQITKSPPWAILIGAHVGESEAAIKGVFAAAAAAAPCVVLLDELDALAPARAGGDGLGGRGNDDGGQGLT
jgi:AAA+ superfamily predicted ATPase